MAAGACDSMLDTLCKIHLEGTIYKLHIQATFVSFPFTNKSLFQITFSQGHAGYRIYIYICIYIYIYYILYLLHWDLSDICPQVVEFSSKQEL